MAVAGSAKVFVTGSQFPYPPPEWMSCRNPSLTCCNAIFVGSIREASNGFKTSQLKTEPATSTPAIRTPMIYPTPIYSGVISAETWAEGKYLLRTLLLTVSKTGDSAITLNIFCNKAYTKANTKTWKADFAKSQPRSPAFKTEAQAVPSGLGSV